MNYSLAFYLLYTTCMKKSFIYILLALLTPQFCLASFKPLGSLGILKNTKRSLIVAGETAGEKTAIAFEAEAKEILKDFKPSQINKQLSISFKDNMLNQVYRFPMEVFTFFVAIFEFFGKNF